MKKLKPLFNILGTVGKDFKKVLVVVSYVFTGLVILTIGFGIALFNNVLGFFDPLSSGPDYSPIHTSITIISIASVVIYLLYGKKGKSNKVKYVMRKILEIWVVGLLIYAIVGIYTHYNSPIKKNENQLENSINSEYNETNNSTIESYPVVSREQIERDTLKIQNVKESFYLGQDTLGGIVFFIQKDTNGDQHGLIVSKTESEGPWQSTPNETITNAKSTWDGESNTDLMTDSPIKDYATSLGKDWYIPAIDELNTLYNARLIVNKSLEKSNYTIIGLRSDYWASVELDQFKAYSLNCANGTIEYGWAKYQTISVRPIKAF